MYRLIYLTSLFLYGYVSFALASSVYDEMYAECLNEFGTINNGIVFECAGRVIDQADKDLSEKIETLRQTRLSEDFDRFLLSQRNWEQYMEIQCDMQGIYVGSRETIHTNNIINEVL
jgi:uncharacterized protein YecT (DUF1311 family)